MMEEEKKGKVLVGDYPITPQMISLEDDFLGRFAKREPETAAMAIVRFLQSENVWRKFTVAELLSGENDADEANRRLYKLFEYGWIIPDAPIQFQPGARRLPEDVTFSVTEEFVNRCFKKGE